MDLAANEKAVHADFYNGMFYTVPTIYIIPIIVNVKNSYLMSSVWCAESKSDVKMNVSLFVPYDTGYRPIIS